MAKKLWIENIDIPAVLWQEATPSGDWLDKTNDAVQWHLYGKQVLDYIFVRDKINNILFLKANPNYPTIDFSGFFTELTSDERLLMCQYVLAPYALRIIVVSEEEDKNNWENLVQITQGTENPKAPFTGRSLIVERMRWEVAHEVRKENLTMEQSQQFFKDVFELTEWYIRAACPEFKLWLASEFETKDYYSSDLHDRLNNIYEGL